MGRIKGELASMDLTEIEEAKVRQTCLACNGKLAHLVKVTYGDSSIYGRPATKTMNEIGVCQNQACFAYTDVSLLTTWVKQTAVLLNERARGSLEPKM